MIAAVVFQVYYINVIVGNADGSGDLHAEEQFLKSRYKNMPRTMLRYAIERFPEPKRKRYLNGKV